MIKIGIVGAAGYTAGELIRILMHHPATKIVSVQSQSNYGKPIYNVHKDLIDETNLVFDKNIDTNTDVLFLCSGHGQSKKFLQENHVAEHTKVIDLSNDFRINTTGNNFTYGLPEAYYQKIEKSGKIANPGCFATSIQLALLPLAAHKLLSSEIHINSITGSTGAGQSTSSTTHFSWRNNNISVYKAFTHQHLAEIKQTINNFQTDFNHNLNFIPLRGNFSRGILTTAYTTCQQPIEEIINIYNQFYKAHPFTIISQQNIDLKMVINTNKCLLHIQKHNNNILITSIIDNLLKGASGQAVQNMNIMFGLPQTTGLQLKGIAF